MLGLAAFGCFLGGIIERFVIEILEKKLSAEAFATLEWIEAAVLALLIVLIAIVCIWRFGRSMELL